MLILNVVLIVLFCVVFIFIIFNITIVLISY